jgi:hypothetical protein
MRTIGYTTCCPKVRLSSEHTSGGMLQEPVSSMGFMTQTPGPKRLPLFQQVQVVSYSLELRVKDVKVC